MSLRIVTSFLAPLVLIAPYFTAPLSSQDGLSCGEEVVGLSMESQDPTPSVASIPLIICERPLSEDLQEAFGTPSAPESPWLCGTATMGGNDLRGLIDSRLSPVDMDSWLAPAPSFEERVARIVRILELMEPDASAITVDRRIELIGKVLDFMTPHDR